jgi:hypothetical protein
MGNEHESIFQYSAEKLNVVKNLFSESAFNSLKANLKALENLAQERKRDPLYVYKGSRSLQESYFSYLSKYSNNLITYTEPQHINVVLNKATHERLFEKFIYHLPFLVQEKEKPVEKVRRRLSKSIANHVNFDAEITSAIVPGLVVPAKVLFIGRNEVQVTGEAKDFSTQKPHLIQQQINAHLFLVDKIKNNNNQNGHFFFIGDEPSKSLKENHKLWRAVKESSDLDLVPTTEVQKIEEYMEKHGVEPVF